jgi:hypothetical protein
MSTQVGVDVGLVFKGGEHSNYSNQKQCMDDVFDYLVYV